MPTHVSITAFLHCRQQLQHVCLLHACTHMSRSGRGSAASRLGSCSLASSCPHLTHLAFHCACYSVLSSDIEALYPLPLTTLSLGRPFHYPKVDLHALQAIGRMLTLRSLALAYCCSPIFPMEGARALSSLSSLTQLTFKVDKVEDTAVELLLHSLPMLEHLDLTISGLTASLAHTLAHHPSLSHLSLSSKYRADPSKIISESKSISSLTVERSHHVSLDGLQKNVHLLHTNLFTEADLPPFATRRAWEQELYERLQWHHEAPWR